MGFLYIFGNDISILFRGLGLKNKQRCERVLTEERRRRIAVVFCKDFSKEKQRCNVRENARECEKVYANSEISARVQVKRFGRKSEEKRMRAKEKASETMVKSNI